jgi:uncharacterized protein YhdP
MQEPKREGATDLRGVERVASGKREGRGRASTRLAFGVCVRVIFWLSLLATILFFATIALARFWIVPNADDFRPRVIEELSRMTKQRVAIGGMTAVWNGWSPELRVTRLQILDSRGRAVLELPEVETTLSWRSLFVFEPRLSALTVKNPRVVVRRTSENQLTLAGIDVDLNDTAPTDPSALEWLLRQRFVQVANGEFEWHDEWRKLPPLRMRNVNIRLINEGANHRMGLAATPSVEIASPVQFRAEFTGSDLRKISDWDGHAYVRVDYANVAALARYLPLPIEIARGDGAIQAWFDFDDGKPTSVITDLVVRDARIAIPASVASKLSGANAPPETTAASAAPRATEPIAVNALSGRFSWQELPLGAGKTLFALAGLGKDTPMQQRWSLRDVAMTTAKGEALPAISGELKLDRVGEDIRGGEFRAVKFDLATASQLADVFASLLPEAWLTPLRESAARGQVNEIEASWGYRENKELRYDVAAKFAAVEWRRAMSVPGVNGLNGKLRMSEREGGFTFEPVDRLDKSTSAVRPNKSASNDKNTTLSSDNKNVLDAKLDRALIVDFGDLFGEPLRVGRVGGAVEWKRMNTPAPAETNKAAANGFAAAGNGATAPVASTAVTGQRAQWQVRSDGVTVENEDMKGRISGTWQSDELGPGIAKIVGKLDRVSTASVHKYLPKGVGANTRSWVKNAVLGGKASNVNIALEGPLWHFPFPEGKLGKFEIAAPISEIALDYADGWPRAENIEGVLTIRGSALNANVAKASISGATIGATQVQIADMANESPVLDIRGSAAASLDHFLQFVEKSPVNRMLDGFTSGAKGSGNGRLTLSLSLPLARADKSKIEGEFAFDNNQIDLGREIPLLENVTGRLRFTEQGVNAKDIAVNALGGATLVNVSTENGAIKTVASGRAELARVRERYDYPLLDQLKGSANWSLEMSTASNRESTEGATFRVKGSFDAQPLPIDAIYQATAAPRDRTQPIAFTLARTSLAQGKDRIEFELPSQLHTILERSAANKTDARTVERAVVDLGAQKTELPVRGYSVRGDLAKLNTDAALALLPSLTGSNAKNVGGVKNEPAAPDFVNVNLKVDRAIVFSHVLNEVSLRAQPAGQRWRLALRSKEATGLISIDNTENGGADAGDVEAVSVRLQRFSWPSPASEADRLAERAAPANQASANLNARTRWPKLDLVADAFVSDGRELGKLEITAQPGPEEWRIENVKLTNPDGTLTASGRWKLGNANAAQGNAPDGQTNVEVALAWKDAGRFMQRFGLPKGVDRGDGELTGELVWPGSPANFAYEKLGGKFVLKTNAGRFSEMEPGIAKLLGVISLQSLPRRLSFNFDDLFGRGFAFDSVNADVSIASGKANTDSFAITGPAARVEIRGTADLNTETAALRVRVFPSISVATAIGVGLITANPAIGAATWLGQKIARDPVERLLMQEFEVSGPWDKPETKQTRGINANAAEGAIATQPAVN